MSIREPKPARQQTKRRRYFTRKIRAIMSERDLYPITRDSLVWIEGNEGHFFNLQLEKGRIHFELWCGRLIASQEPHR